MMTTYQTFDLFPTPFLSCQSVLDQPKRQASIDYFQSLHQLENNRSSGLSHSHIISNTKDPLVLDLIELLKPHLSKMGSMLFGEQLPWIIKELWINILQTGGQQSIHNHSNSFISGVLYLTDIHPSAQTLFIKSLSGNEYVFRNNHQQSETNAYNAERWMAPDIAAGDLVLFPSYLLHEVPVNQGGLRITIAFNAVPERLNSWGYHINFVK